MRAPLAMGGNKITNVAPGTAPTDVATVSQIGESVSVPLGSVIDYWGSTPPAGYLFCAGQAVSRTTYAALFAVIGTAAGAGDGSTTFNLPDYRGRVAAGRDNMNGTSAERLNTLASTTLGASGGSQAHTLTEAQMPAHSHTVTDPGHSHSFPASDETGGSTQRIRKSNLLENANFSTEARTTGITIASAGGGSAHNNVQPTIIANKIIRAI